jgi:hypothetical protein
MHAVGVSPNSGKTAQPTPRRMNTILGFWFAPPAAFAAAPAAGATDCAFAEWLTGVRTLVLAVVANFQDSIPGWVYRPKFQASIKTEPPDCTAVLFSRQDGTLVANSIYVRLWVQNIESAPAKTSRFMLKNCNTNAWISPGSGSAQYLQVVTRVANFYKSASDDADWSFKAKAMRQMALAMQKREHSQASKTAGAD